MGTAHEERFGFLSWWTKASWALGWFLLIVGCISMLLALIFPMIHPKETSTFLVFLVVGGTGVATGIVMVCWAQLILCFLAIERNTRVVAELLHRNGDSGGFAGQGAGEKVLGHQGERDRSVDPGQTKATQVSPVSSSASPSMNQKQRTEATQPVMSDKTHQRERVAATIGMYLVGVICILVIAYVLIIGW